MACGRYAALQLAALLALLAVVDASSPSQELEVVSRRQREEAIREARWALMSATNWALASSSMSQQEEDEARGGGVAWRDCVRLYQGSERRLSRDEYEAADAQTWLSAALTGHRTCTEGLRQRNVSVPLAMSRRMTALLGDALALHALPAGHEQTADQFDQSRWNSSTAPDVGLLISWDSSKNNADVVVAQDGSGNYKTINEAVAVLGTRQQKRNVIYVKSGVYKEYVEINMKNIMFVGDGVGRTIVTGSRSVRDGHTTFSSATFSVSGDDFWARDMTFENTAGPDKYQAVAVTAASDRCVFYRCGFRGYQDTLFAHSLRQFYRDCQVYGTVDFIFGNAAAVLQNCDIYVRRPMYHQSNMITAQGRDDPNQNTGISIHGSRVRPAQDFEEVKGSFRSYLGRPWKKYSRTVFLETDLDGLVSPEGWARWSGDFAIGTLYYAEYKNTGDGAATGRRVNWPGVHVLSDPGDAAPFTVERFIQGQSWIPQTGVPFWSGL